MRWICGILVMSLFIGCATNRQTTYEKVSLSVSTVDDINRFLENEQPGQALQYLQALKNFGIHIPSEDMENLFSRGARLLYRQFQEAWQQNDYDAALSKFRSIKSIEEFSPQSLLQELYIEDIGEGDILLARAKKHLDDDEVLAGLTLLQEALRVYPVPTDVLLSFVDPVVEEMNVTAARNIYDKLLLREEEIPSALQQFLDRKSDFTEMLNGTVTIWVNRGMTIEAGVGYPDRAIGSGFFIDKRGYLLTNYHVIYSEVDPEYEGFSRLYIKLSKDPETKIPAKVIGFDRILDIALLKVEVTPEYIFSLSDKDTFIPGEQLYAIGSPIGLENTITSGIVSATGRRFLQMGEAVQVDVPVNQGNSGGPLIDKTGRLVGVIFAGIEQYEGINFAIPANWIHMILPKLFIGGEVHHPWLGAAVKETEEGLEIMYVLPGEPADIAGLRQGDVIQTFNGKAYSELLEIQREIIRSRTETLVSISWLRDEEKMSGLCYFTERPFRPMDLALKRDIRDNIVTPLFGMELQETDNVFWRNNYTVEKVYKGSIADETGLSQNDPVSIQKWEIDEEYRIAVLKLFVMKRTAGFLEKAVQLAAYLEIDNFI